MARRPDPKKQARSSLKLPPQVAAALWQFRLALTSLLLLVCIGVFYYMAIEPRLNGDPQSWKLVDAIFMTIITLATVGYREVHPLSDAGKLFTVAFIVAGVILAAWAVRSSAELILGGQFAHVWERRKRFKMLSQVRDHYIICGCGQMGQEIVSQLRRHRVPVVVVEKEHHVALRLQQQGIPYVEGNATHDEVLELAGLAQARGLVAVTNTDEDNLYIVLSARVLRPELHIVARAESQTAQAKLLRAGATKVLSPHITGAREIAAAILRPGLAEFLEFLLRTETVQLDLAKLTIGEDSGWKNLELCQAGLCQPRGAVVIALQRPDGDLVTNPSPDTRVHPGDAIFAMGTPDQLARLKELSASVGEAA